MLDIGLPKLNGIEAARQIRLVSPDSKLMFLTGNNDPEVAREALCTGATGDVSKLDAAVELLNAVEAVLLGKQFVSKGLPAAA
jgi:two-component system nitrate/nitrite response regulator NarL